MQTAFKLDYVCHSSIGDPSAIPKESDSLDLALFHNCFACSTMKSQQWNPMWASVLGRSSAYPTPVLRSPRQPASLSSRPFLFHGQHNANHFCKVSGNISSPLPKPSTLPWEELSFGMSLFHYNAFNPSTVDFSLSGCDEFVYRCISNNEIYYRFSEVRKSPARPLAFCASNTSSKSTCLVASAWVSGPTLLSEWHFHEYI